VVLNLILQQNIQNSSMTLEAKFTNLHQQLLKNSS
jgi:hypothetical protein